MSSVVEIVAPVTTRESRLPANVAVVLSCALTGCPNGISTELMFTRSASRGSDGYFSGGWEWKEAVYENINGQRVETQPYRSDPVWETGVKFRIGLPEGKIRWLFLGYGFEDRPGCPMDYSSDSTNVTGTFWRRPWRNTVNRTVVPGFRDST